MTLRIALPKGRLLIETAALLEKAGWKLAGYDSALRNYRLKSARFPELQIKVLHEKDIPIQVAIGNYDLGISGLDWIEELASKYAAERIVRIKDLGYGKGSLYVASSRIQKLTLQNLCQAEDTVRIATEYPNIAESFALGMRLRRYCVFPVWGAADAYPPESATLALVSGSPDTAMVNHGLVPLSCVLNYSAYLIANRRSWERKDLSELLHTFEMVALEEKHAEKSTAKFSENINLFPSGKAAESVVRIALPDGHAQKHTVAIFNKAGIQIEDYPSSSGNRRPKVKLEGVAAKVIRPQDMPLQVANGNFDLAITGYDWITDHLAAFPASPVRELVDLKLSWVKIVAVVGNDVPAASVYDVRKLIEKQDINYRVASEYTNLADKYARENRLGMYRIVPTWGATEAFLPEDADMLIENTETGSTIARHNLKIIDTLFESTARLIGRKETNTDPLKQKRIDNIVRLLSTAANLPK
ncbi:MAG TPA: ATP phosphoribosyltransferase [Dehalococcoidales bacterium]|nr:ATP phosphoribosyltransferase [Dehalococcoidales bacterium]